MILNMKDNKILPEFSEHSNVEHILVPQVDSRYIERPIAQEIRRSRRKVVIVEGARAVGKTLMATHQLTDHGFSYVTLADSNMYELAQLDLRGWLGSLRLPVIIDEAQRIPGLPLEVKEIADQLPSGKPLFVLTGSAMINASGLDGQNPLARRSQRFVMSPLTRREMLADSRSLVDDLWQGKVNTAFHSSITRGELYDLMRAGGFPEYLLEYDTYSDWEREALVISDIDATLGDTILPGEKLDVSIAQAILGRLLCMPGGILNASAIGNTLDLDRRTVDRYISIFARRYLIHSLPNLRSAPNRQSFARSKIHPVDTSLSVETLLKSGVDPSNDPIVFGNIFESYVINQIVPSSQWSLLHPDCLYWREPGSNPKEVDLMLSHRNEIVGIEVKSSQRVTRNDFKGLAALADDGRFRAGYVVYTGADVLKWSNNLWAIPVTMLWEPGGFEYSSSDPTHVMP